MVNNRFRYEAIAGTAAALLLALAPNAHSQIAVQGGTIRGDAAFFNPNIGKSSLFDATIRTLNLRTSNGTTNTSVFLPSASSYNAQTNFPTSGDTGRLEGTLAGVAFTRGGVPIGFSGVPTALNFTLTSFNSGAALIGSLISPKTGVSASPLFFPVINVRLDSTSTPFYETPLAGSLAVGLFAADVTGGQINLPSSLEFRPLSGLAVPQILLGIPTRFEFAGVKPVTATPGIVPTNLNPLTGSVAFQGDGDANNLALDVAFTVQTAGGPPVSGFADGVRFGADGVDSFLQVGSLSDAEGTRTFFRVSGVGIGVSSFVQSTTYGYIGPRTATNFFFQQATGSLQGTTNGPAILRLGTLQPTGGFTLSVKPGVGAPPFQPQNPNPATSNTASNTASSPPIGGGSPSSGGGNGGGSGSNPGSSAGRRVGTVVLFQPNNIEVIRLFTIASLRETRYVLIDNREVEIILVRGDARENLYLIRTGDGRAVGGYVEVGPPSGIFPGGLVGLKPISPDEIPPQPAPPQPAPKPPNDLEPIPGNPKL